MTTTFAEVGDEDNAPPKRGDTITGTCKYRLLCDQQDVEQWLMMMKNEDREVPYQITINL